jgi:hypothetical protein
MKTLYSVFKIKPNNLTICDTRTDGKKIEFFESEEHVLMTMIDLVHENLKNNRQAQMNLRDRVMARMAKGRKFNNEKF